MLKELAEDHVVLYLLLMLVLAITLGVVATYLIGFILAIYEITKFIFLALVLIGGSIGG